MKKLTLVACFIIIVPMRTFACPHEYEIKDSIPFKYNLIDNVEQQYSSQENGFIINIPEGWVKLSLEEIKELSANLKKTQSLPYDLEIGFERNGDVYPRVIVVVMKYSSYGLNRRAYKNEVKELSDSMFKEKDLVGEYIDFHGNKIYSIYNEVDVPIFGKVKVETMFFFGGHAIVQLIFSDYAENWNLSKSERELLRSSMKFKQLFEIVPANFNNRKKNNSNSLFVNIVIYGSISLFIFLLGLIRKLFNKKKDGKNITETFVEVKQNYKNGKYDIALKELDDIISDDSENTNAFYYRALVNNKLKKKQNMVNDLRMAARLGHMHARKVLTEKNIKF